MAAETGRRPSDGELVAEIAAEIADLPSYGYRRAAAHCDGH